MAQDMKKVKCELCDGRGWIPVGRTRVIDKSGEYAYVLESFRQTCLQCDGKGEVPPLEERKNE